MSTTLRRATLVLTAVIALILSVPCLAGATPAPAFSRSWGGSGTGDGQFNGQNFVAADRMGHLYVADTSNNRIQRFLADGTYDAQWNSNGTALLDYPAGIGVDRFAFVYVTEAGAGRVDKYMPSGAHLSQIGLGAGPDPGHFVSPSGIAVDPWGFVYVADSPFGFGRVQKFAPDGSYVSAFGTSGSGTLGGYPSGVSIDYLGNVYVADSANNRIVVYGPTGAFVRAFGSTGSSAGSLDHPRQLAFAPDGNLLVADYFNGRVQAFSTAGAYQYMFGPSAVVGQNTVGPCGLATDGSGIYVGDSGDATIKKFTFGASKPVARIGGANRYALAANVAAARWPRYRGMRHVVIVNGENSAQANALAVSPLAGIYDAPILLTKKSKLSKETNTALKAMRAASGPLVIHVIGDKRLISNAAYKKIKADNRGGSVERINGHDPYTLSAAIASRVNSVQSGRGLASGDVMVFNAQKPSAYFDALMAGPGAARSGIPMLAVKTSSVPAPVSRMLATTFAGKEKLAVNSTTHLSAAMYARVGGTHRLSAHADPAASGADIAMWSREGLTSWDSIGAVGTVPAAIVAGPYMGLQNGALLYTRRTSWPSANTTFLASTTEHSSALRGKVIGSTKDVTNATMSRFWVNLNGY